MKRPATNLSNLWAWRSDANAPAPNLLAPQGPRPEMRPGPTPTLRDRVFDYIYGALGGTPSQRSTASALTDLADFATLGVPTALDQGVRDVAAGQGPFALGMALVPGAKLGKAAGKAAGRAAKAVLPMDAESVASRQVAMGMDPNEPFWRGDASGRLPNQYKAGAFFSRDPEYARGFANRGGHDDPREFRLDLRKTFVDYNPVTAGEVSRLIEAAEKVDPPLAAKITALWDLPVDRFKASAARNPGQVVLDSGAALRAMMENSSKAHQSVFLEAGYDAFDFGRDVLKLRGDGIRLASAKFDPAKAKSQNILAGVSGAAALPTVLNGGRTGDEPAY